MLNLGFEIHVCNYVDHTNFCKSFQKAMFSKNISFFKELPFFNTAAADSALQLCSSLVEYTVIYLTEIIILYKYFVVFSFVLCNIPYDLTSTPFLYSLFDFSSGKGHRV